MVLWLALTSQSNFANPLLSMASMVHFSMLYGQKHTLTLIQDLIAAWPALQLRLAAGLLRSFLPNNS